MSASGERGRRASWRPGATGRTAARAARVCARLLVALCVLLGTVLGLAAVGLYLPLPVVNVVGALLTTVWAWAALAALALLVLLAWLLLRRRTAWRAVGAVAAVAALVGFPVAGVQQAGVARDNGVEVSPLAVGVSLDVPDERLTYTDAEGNELPMAAYLPHEPAGAPVVMWIHGGGWVGGAYDVTVHNRWLADQGYLVVSAEYTLSDEGTHLWQATNDQLLCAMGEVARYARAQGADSARVATMGESAGGHLALTVGYTAGGTNPCGGGLPEVAAVAPVYPVASPAGFYANRDILLGSSARRMASAFTGGSPQDVPEAYAAIDPAGLVDAGSPPTFVVVGENDHLVPPQGAYDLAEALDDVGVANRLIRVPFGEHVMDLNTEGAAARVYREGAVEFLRAHGLSPGA